MLKMKRLYKIALLVIALAFWGGAQAQTYLKLNALYAVCGVINPQVEFCFSPHSSVQIEATYSPWRSIGGKHANFGIFMGEYRYYFREAASGWYVSANAGMTGFDVNKPRLFHNGLISFKDEYGKGFGLLVGVGAGYQHIFRERWVVDAFIAIDYMRSWYNGYAPDGGVVMNPAGHENYEKPDPFNGSSEIIPAKIGVSIGYRLFNPAKRK